MSVSEAGLSGLLMHNAGWAVWLVMQDAGWAVWLLMQDAGLGPVVC